MSEAPTTAAAPLSAAAAGEALFPDGGANPLGADSAAGAASVSGTDSAAAPVSGETGTDSVSGSDTGTLASGADSVSGSEGPSAIDPASYEFTFPADYTPDDALMTSARETLAAAGVPKEHAQSLMDLYISAQANASAAAELTFTTQQSEWLTEINAMPEFTGSTREKSVASLGRLMDEYGSPEAKAALNSYGIGNNPALVKFILKVANALNEGEPAAPGRPAANSRDGKSTSGNRSMGQILFPDQPTN